MERFLPLGVTLLTVLSNSLGGSIKEISDKYKLEITPAPYTFSIWGVIYSLLAYVTFTHYDAILNTKTPFGSIFMLFIISSVLNALWIQAWGKSLEISSLILILLTIVLTTITIELIKANVDKIIIYAFGIYAAWCFCASIINLMTLLKDKNVLSNKTIKILVAGILTVVPFLLKDVFNNSFNAALIPILGVFIWASIGIIMNKNNNLLFIAPIASSVLNIFI
jgi:hypothetical protein